MGEKLELALEENRNKDAVKDSRTLIEIYGKSSTAKSPASSSA